MGIFDRFPYSSTHEMNLDFMLGKATEIAESLQEIDTHKEQAEQAATNATQSAQSAAQAAQAAAGSQTAAGTSASQAAQHKADAEDAADRAEAASNLADEAVEHAQTAAQTAGTAAQNASTAADGAIASATAAETRINNLAASLPADFTELNEDVNNLNNAVSAYQNVIPANVIDGYVYKDGYYFNSSLNLVTNNACKLYRFPVSFPDFVCFEWTGDSPFGDFTTTVVITYETTNGTLERTDIRKYAAYRTVGNWFFAYPKADTKYIYIILSKETVYQITNFHIGSLLTEDRNTYKKYKGIEPFSGATRVVMPVFKNTSELIAELSGDATAIWSKVISGDVINVAGLVSGISYGGGFITTSGMTRIQNVGKFTCPSEGLVFVFDSKTTPMGHSFIPANRIKLEYGDILNVPIIENMWNGRTGVAFGTSLTYRAQTTGGYLQYLPALSGITWDNQGIGSSEIQGNMLTAIKNYSGYSSKNVCILEGFVNDWWYNPETLGTWKDNTENTVCGCVRSAINYIYSQNPDITLFLVLDPYGKNANDFNNSSTAVNSNNKTQYEFYEEIAKVAESLGVPVIKLYAISEISENTPQYIMDNIHPTTLGAEQTAKVIWAQMKNRYPNVTE